MTARNRGGAADELGRYYTDTAVARAIVRRCVDSELLHEGSVVLEPSSGGGAYLDALHDLVGCATYAIDTDPRAPSMSPAHRDTRTYIAHVGDCLQPTPAGWPDTFDVVIGNPPYSVKGPTGRWVDEASRHVLHSLTVSRHVVFLLRAGFMGLPRGPEHPRRKLHKQLLPRAIWEIWPRPSFTGKGTDMAEYAAIWWDREHTGTTEWIPLEWLEETP